MPYYATGSELPHLRAFDTRVDRDNYVAGYCSNEAITEQEARAMLEGVDRELATATGIYGLGCYIGNGTGFAPIGAKRLLQTHSLPPGICNPPVAIPKGA